LDRALSDRRRSERQNDPSADRDTGGDRNRPPAAAKVVENYVRNAQEVVAADVAKRTADMLLDIETLAGIRPVLDLLVKRS
jgi:hypothetical protein